MTTPEALNALADRVEREGASVDLDAAIGRAIGNHNGGMWWTRKLEDAASLAPENAQEIVVRKYPDGRCYVRITVGGETVYSDKFHRRATEAESRAAAALRARAADMQAPASPTHAFFEEEDGLLRHGRVDHELANAQGNAERRAEAARRAAEARWNKPQDDAPGNAPRMRKAMRGECPPPSPSDNPHGETMTAAARASASPDGPPRSRLPDTAKWAGRLDGYSPWLPVGDPKRGKWHPTWGPDPESAGRNPLIPAELLKAWQARRAVETTTVLSEWRQEAMQ